MKAPTITEGEWLAELETVSRPPKNAVRLVDLCQKLACSRNWARKALSELSDKWGSSLFVKDGKLVRYVWPKTSDAIPTLIKHLKRMRDATQ